MDRASKSSDRADKDQVQSQEVEGENAAGDAGAEPESIWLAVKLLPKQRIAVDALAAGCSGVEAARQADVDVSTVRRWRNYDAKFIAAFNALNLDNIRSSRAEMAALLPLAGAALRKELEKGNGWLALQFYREARSLGLLEVGPTSPKAVKEQIKLAQQIHEAELMKKQVQLREQQLEIEKLKEKLDRRDSDKQIEAAKEEGYWYAWIAFYRAWCREREDPNQERNAQLAKREQDLRLDRGKYERAFDELSDEKSRQIIIEADRLQQQDLEKKQRGLRVKSAAQQAMELHDKGLRADKKRAKGPDSQQQQPDEPGAEDRQRAAEQPSSNDPQPTPDSPRLKKPGEVDLWEAEHEEADEEGEEREVTEHRPVAVRRPADDSAKSNPDIEPPPTARSEQNPPATGPEALGASPGRETELIKEQLEEDEREQHRQRSAYDGEDDDAIPAV